ncbi:MAG: hypothetical protein PSV16_00535 [Flavobacterium sp.]|nr:hypothetical protein [Flavobacterium sp.]
MESNNPIPESNFLFFIAAREGMDLSTRDKRNVYMLAISSIAICLFHSFAILWVIELHVSYMIISIIIQVFVFILLLLVNRMFFLFYIKNYQAKALLLFVYSTIYLALSFWVIPLPFEITFLMPEILAKQEDYSALKLFAAYSKVINHLNLYELKARQDYRLLVSGLAAIFSFLPLTVHILIQKNTKSLSEEQSENLRLELEQKIYAKRLEYNKLFDPYTGDNSLFDDETPVDRQKRAEELSNDIFLMTQNLHRLS